MKISIILWTGLTREAMVRKRHAVMEKKCEKSTANANEQMVRQKRRRKNKQLRHWEIKTAESERQNKYVTVKVQTINCNKLRTATNKKWGTVIEKNDSVTYYRPLQMSHQMLANANSASPRWLHINLTLLLQMWFYWLHPWFTPRQRVDWHHLTGHLQTKHHSREEEPTVEVAS